MFFQNKIQKLYLTGSQLNKTDFSRYNSFYARYLESIGKNQQAKKVILQSLEKFPRNLLLNQYKIDLEKQQNNFNFNCQKEQDVVAEILYIAANALSSQSMYQTSNFYLNLSKYLNKDFNTFDTLIAENFYKIEDFTNAKKIYERLKRQGSAFRWYSNKQIARILVRQDQKDKSLKLLNKSFNYLSEKGIYATFDYAEFLKNN